MGTVAGAASLTGGHRRTKAWPLTGSRQRDRELPGKPPHQRHRPKPPAAPARPPRPAAPSFSPWQRGLEPAVTSSCPPSGTHIASKAGRRLPGKGSDPSPAAPAGNGMGELGQSQGRAPGWPPWPGAGREVVAAAAPSREGWLPVPAADATPQPPPASASPAAWPQPQTKHLGLGERSSSRRQDNPQTTGAGWARLEVKAKPATGTGWGDICLSKGNTPLLWEPSQANDFPISFTIKPVQVLCCKEPLCSAVPLQR